MTKDDLEQELWDTRSREIDLQEQLEEVKEKARQFDKASDTEKKLVRIADGYSLEEVIEILDSGVFR